MAAPMVKTNEAGIYKRGSRYVVVYYADGRQRKESAPTLIEARKLKRLRQSEADRGMHRESSRLHFESFAREWIERYHGKPGREFRESTRDDYRRDVEFSIRFFGPKKELGQITAHDVNRFVNWLNDPAVQGRQFAPSTLRNKVAPLAACLATAFAEQLIPSNPAIRVNYPGAKITATIEGGDLEGETEQNKRALTVEELQTFLAILPEEHRLLFEFLALTGLRVGEVNALQWRHLSLTDSPHVSIRRQIYRGRVQPPKSASGRRDVPLSIDLADSLQSWRDQSRYPGDLELVFPGRGGVPFSQSHVFATVLKPVAGEAGVEWASYHTFRHTCASILFSQGRNIVQVQRWLGHSSPDFTLKKYVHLMGDGVGEALTIETAGVATKVAIQPAETDVDSLLAEAA